MKKYSESGFSLLELVVALAIVGIIAAIVVPNFTQAKTLVNSTIAKTTILQTIPMLEDARQENNGLYPTYVPNRMLVDKVLRFSTYTYSDNRLSYCVTLEDSSNEVWALRSGESEPYKVGPGNPACHFGNYGEGTYGQ